MTRILVVDDSPTIRRVVTNILEVSGFDTVEATDGQDALDVLKSGEAKVDLVLLDFVMPRMNGFQFARALKKEETQQLSSLPIILMSAKSDRIRAQFVEQTGSLDAIGKPFDAEALLTVVENALRRKNERPTTPKLVDPADVADGSEPEVAGPVSASAVAAADVQDIDDDDEDLIVLDSFPPEDDGAADPTVLRVASPSMGLASTLRETFAPVVEALTDPETALRMSQVITKDNAAAIIRAATPVAYPDPVLLSGDLSVLSASAILQLLTAEEQTGRLLATRGKSEITVTFRGGKVDLVQSREAGDEFRLGRYFVSEGLVKPEEVDAVARGVALPKRDITQEQNERKKSAPPPSSSHIVAEPSKTISVELPAATQESPKLSTSEDAITSPGGSDAKLKEASKRDDAEAAPDAKPPSGKSGDAEPEEPSKDASEAVDETTRKSDAPPKSGIHPSAIPLARKIEDEARSIEDESTPIASQDLVQDVEEADLGDETRIVASAFKAKVEMPRDHSSGVLGGADVEDAPDSSGDLSGDLEDAPSSRPPPTVIMSAANAVPKGTGPRPLLGDALVLAGIITEEQLRDALIRQSSELIYELLRWKNGRFELASAPPPPLAERTKLALPVAQLVMEGFRRVDAWQALEKSVGDYESVIYRDDSVMKTMKEDAITRAERRVLDAVDGERTVREVIAASHLGSFDACRILAQFLEARIVRRRSSEITS